MKSVKHFSKSSPLDKIFDSVTCNDESLHNSIYFYSVCKYYVSARPNSGHNRKYSIMLSNWNRRGVYISKKIRIIGDI